VTINLSALVVTAVIKDLALLWAWVTSSPWILATVIVLVVLAFAAEVFRPVTRRRRPRSAYRR
jgi:hypothetical protein